MSKHDIMDKMFEVTGKLELMQALIGDLINKTESVDGNTVESAIQFASQKDTIASFLHIAHNGICDSINILEDVQKKGGAA